MFPKAPCNLSYYTSLFLECLAKKDVRLFDDRTIPVRRRDTHYIYMAWFERPHRIRCSIRRVDQCIITSLQLYSSIISGQDDDTHSPKMAIWNISPPLSVPLEPYLKNVGLSNLKAQKGEGGEGMGRISHNEQLGTASAG